MIELFDAERLLRRRDHSLALGVLVLALGAGGMGLYAVSLQTRLNGLISQSNVLDKEIARFKDKGEPTPALVADLQQQVERLEGDVAAASGGPLSYGLAASQWLDRLSRLSSGQVSLNKIEIDRSGSARVEGMAQSPQAVSGFVQAWGEQDKLGPVRARSLQVRQDKTSTSLLRFQLRANAPVGARADAPVGARADAPVGAPATTTADAAVDSRVAGAPGASTLAALAAPGAARPFVNAGPPNITAAVVSSQP